MFLQSWDQACRVEKILVHPSCRYAAYITIRIGIHAPFASSNRPSPHPYAARTGDHGAELV